MEYVYVILGLVVWVAIYSFFNKIYLDKTFKKFEMGEDKWCFKPSLNRVLLFYVFPNAALIAGMAYYFYSIDKLDFDQLMFIFIVIPLIAIVYITRPLKAIKGDYQITLKDNIAEFKSKKDIRIDLSKCNSINEKRGVTSRRSETYIFKLDENEFTINFHDFVLNVYAERIVDLMKTKINASIQH
jgi:hypothetical protein